MLLISGFFAITATCRYTDHCLMCGCLFIADVGVAVWYVIPWCVGEEWITELGGWNLIQSIKR